MLLEGKGPYVEMHEMENLSPTADENANAPFILRIKTSMLPSSKTLCIGENVTKEILSRSTFLASSPKIAGKTLFEHAKLQLKNCKKALSFLLPLVDKNGQPRASGHTIQRCLEDYSGPYV